MQNNRANFEDDLQRILSEFLRDRDRDHFDRFREPTLNNRFSRPRTRTFPRANVNQNIPSNINNLSIILESLNDNMIRYQENLTSYLTLLTELVTNEEVYERLNNNRPAQRTSFFSRNRPFTFNTGTTTTDVDTNTDPLITYGMRLFTNPSENINLFENVVVHPTPLQIAQSTDLVTYQDTGLFLNIFEDIINQTRGQLSTIFDGSNNLALRLEIPISYTETYDASNNLISREINN